jgi:hypothetical protein
MLFGTLERKWLTSRRRIELGASNDRLDLATLSASRRKSVMGIAAAAFGAAFLAPDITKAGKVGKKVKKKCKKQEQPCDDFGTLVCTSFFAPGDQLNSCLAAMFQCCDSLAVCDATTFFPCISTALNGLVPV